MPAEGSSNVAAAVQGLAELDHDQVGHALELKVRRSVEVLLGDKNALCSHARGQNLWPSSAAWLPKLFRLEQQLGTASLFCELTLEKCLVDCAAVLLGNQHGVAFVVRKAVEDASEPLPKFATRPLQVAPPRDSA